MNTAAIHSWHRAIALLLLSCFASIAHAEATADGACHIGAYRLSDARVIDVSPADGGLRWRDGNGITGLLTPPSAASPQWQNTPGWTANVDQTAVSFGSCDSGSIQINGVTGEKLPLQITDTRFRSHDTQLSGRLTLPPGTGPVPIVILLHGAERNSAVTFNYLQRLLPAMGVGSFVYDKRGTGQSQGVYTQDFSLLADDAVAALAEARRLAGPRAGRIGYQGPSQGGWIAPLAATRSRVDFIIVSFGLAVSVIEEDSEAVAFSMRLKGHGDREIASALEVAHAAQRLFENGFTDGFEEFDAVRQRYRDEPWYRDIRGNFTHLILGMSVEELRRVGPSYRFGTPFRYNPMPTIRAIRAPQLWVLGGQDLDAPEGETSRRLSHLINRGRPITLALYPNAEHGMTEFQTSATGERQSTRYSAGYFQMIRDFAAGQWAPPYGDAEITRARR